VVNITLLVFLPKTIALVLLATAIQLIGLSVLVLLVAELWVLWQAYTKTTKARGRVTSTTCGGPDLSTYEELKMEDMIQSSSHWARYGGNTPDDPV